MPEPTQTQTDPTPAAAPSGDDWSRVFDYDPFPGGELPSDGQPGNSQEEPSAPPTTTPPQPSEGGTPPAVQEPPAPAESPEVLALRQQVAELRGQVSGLAQQRQPATAAGDETARQRQELLRSFSPQFPPALQNAFLGEDPNVRLQALGAVLAAQSVHVYERAMAAMEQRLQQALPQFVDSRMQTADVQRQAFTTFYGENQDLNDPSLYPIVGRVAAGLFQERGNTVAWDKATRDEIARRVKAIVTRVAGGAPRLPAKTPAIMPNGSRPGTPSGSPNTPAAIADTLFG